MRDDGLLESCIQQVSAGFGSVEFYPDVIAKAARLSFAFSENQPFIDGNKRTGLLAMAVTLRRNGFFLLLTQKEVYDTIVAMAANKPADWNAYHARIRENAKPRII